MHSCLRFAAAAVAAAFIAGCATPQSSPLPAGAQKVGGGLSVEWRPSQAGTVIVYDTVYRRMIATRSVDASEYFSFPSGPSEDELLKNLYPSEVELAKARLELYFVPK
jgi:hypothetical protein